MVKLEIIAITLGSALLIIIIIISSFMVAVVIDSKTHYFSKLLDNIIADSKNHYLSCGELPTVEEVDRVVKEHKDTVEQIIKVARQRMDKSEVTPVWNYGSVNGGSATDGETSYISFTWGESFYNPNCENTGKGDIEILYPVHQDRVLIEKIISGSTFFGIPYKLRNV